MNKILISGYYGYDNLGDEAVLETILNNIRSVIEDSEITVLSSNPMATTAKYDVNSVGRSSIMGVIKALSKCDVLISGGGSLLQDVTSRLSIFYYLLIIMFGRMMGKKVMIYSQGIGPIRKPFNRRLTKWILNNIQGITVRESYSKTDLVEMGVRESLVEVTADPVVSMDVDHSANGIEVLKQYTNEVCINKPKIGFALRGKAYSKDLESRILKTIELIRSKMDVTIVFIPFYYNEDIKTINEIKKTLDGDVIYLEKRHDAKEILGITKELDVLVGERLHSLIFAAISCVPMVALSYDPKIHYFMETIESKAEFEINTFEPMLLVDRIFETYEQKSVLKENLEKNMIKLNIQLKKNETILNDILNRKN